MKRLIIKVINEDGDPILGIFHPNGGYTDRAFKLITLIAKRYSESKRFKNATARFIDVLYGCGFVFMDNSVDKSKLKEIASEVEFLTVSPTRRGDLMCDLEQIGEHVESDEGMIILQLLGFDLILVDVFDLLYRETVDAYIGNEDLTDNVVTELRKFENNEVFDQSVLDGYMCLEDGNKILRIPQYLVKSGNYLGIKSE